MGSADNILKVLQGWKSQPAKIMAPFLGPLVKEAKWRVDSGMATQGAAPPAGTAKREISNTASEGHFCSAASFVASI
jgi:hypothetical protein